MVVIAPSDGPEPEREPTWEEQVASYRGARRAVLKRTATVLSLPVRTVKAVLSAAAGN